MIEKDSELKIVQDRLLQMLHWYHNFCEKYNLRYYIIGGTMLGAIRHNGFIPWDDDIDVAMPREDYEKLRILIKNEKFQTYIFEFPSVENKDYPYLYAKLFDTQSTLIESMRYPVKRGLYIDVFPLDGIGDNMESGLKNFERIYKKIRLDSMITCAFRKKRKWYKNLSIVIGRILSPLFIKKEKLTQKIEMKCKKRAFDESLIVGNLLGNWGQKEIMPKDFFGKPTLVAFESIKVYGVEQPDSYLTALYGNYMQPPPIEKQISHHDYIYRNLNESYLK